MKIKKNNISQDEKDYYVDLSLETGTCYLDDSPAFIKGKLLPFAEICNSKYSASFSWYAVKRIMEKNGRFSS